MADPVTWAIVIGATTAAVGAASAGMSYDAQKTNADNEKAAAELNADLLDQNAKVEADQAGARQVTQQQQARRVLAAQRAALLQNSGEIGGSDVAMVEQGEHMAALDKLNINYEGQLAARGLKQQAAGQRWNADISRNNKKTAKVNLGINIASAMLSGASTAYMGGAFGSGAKPTGQVYAPQYGGIGPGGTMGHI